MGPYDSPTFLSRKDKLLMGLTLQQFGVVFGGGLVWLLMALALDQPLTTSMLIFGPAHVVTVALYLVRPAGVMIPVYLMLALKSMITAPVYHVEAETLRTGLPEWFKEQLSDAANQQVAGAGLRSDEISQSGGISSRFVGALLFFRKKAAQEARGNRVAESREIAKLEAEHRAGEAVQGAERSIRTMVKLLVKGRM